jgi:coiled-coil domain-containing protein 115
VVENNDKMLHFSVVERSPQDPPDQNEDSEKHDTNIESKTGNNGTDLPPLAPDERDENPQIRMAKDPIRWYGFSVPSSLRVAQAQFTTVVEIPVPRILKVTQEMRQLENEIGRLRKTIRKLENT